MWKPFAAGALAVAAVIAGAAPARADTHIQYVDATGKPASQVYVKDGSVRLEREGGPTVVWDTAAVRLTTIDAATGTYTVLDKAGMDRIGEKVRQAELDRALHSGRLSDAQKRAVEEVARMTPEQRALLEQMVGTLPGLGPAPKVEVQDLGSGERIAGHACNDVVVLAWGMKVARMCVVELDALELPPLDRAALQAMHDGIHGMVKAMGQAAPAVPDLVPKGLALKYEPGDPDRPSARPGEIVRAITAGPVAADLFRVPAGYKEQPFPEPK